MAFENVDVGQLKNAIYACKNAIQYQANQEISTSISNNTIWQTGSRDKLKKAIDTLVNERYKDLEAGLDKCSQIVDLIGQYQQTNQENKNMEQEIAQLNTKLYYQEKTTTTSTDADGNQTTTTETKTVKDKNVENKINTLKRKISTNVNTMQNLESKISSEV